MGKYRYDDIRGLIASAEQDGPVMKCTFRCTISGHSVDSAAPIVEPGAMQKFQDRAKQGIWYSIRRAIFYRLRRMFGHGLLGQMAAELGAGAVEAARDFTEHTYSDEQLDAAKVRAYEQVAASFRWDQGMGQFVWASEA